MALQPLDRPAESTQVIRYRGLVVPGQAIATYPKTNGTATTQLFPPAAPYDAWVRFALFDSTALTNTARKLPLNVYDDEAPAGAAPHAPVASAVVFNAINASDLSLNTKTWAQNLQIHFNNIDANVLFCDNAVSVDNDGANGAIVMLDSASSGLGGSVGLPVVAVRFRVTSSAQVPVTEFSVDITFELRHSNLR